VCDLLLGEDLGMLCFPLLFRCERDSGRGTVEFFFGEGI
jgi:hypothetical protein